MLLLLHAAVACVMFNAPQGPAGRARGEPACRGGRSPTMLRTLLPPLPTKAAGAPRVRADNIISLARGLSLVSPLFLCPFELRSVAVARFPVRAKQKGAAGGF